MARFDGTDNNDIHNGTDSSDQIAGRAGDDILNGLGGADQIWGDAGADIVNGGDGDDYLYAGGGDDSDASSDQLNGGSGFDRLYGGWGDHFDGGDNPANQGDFAYLNLAKATGSVIFDLGAGQGVKQAISGGGSIVGVEVAEIWTGAFSDRVKGGMLDDKVHGGAGHDALYGGDGADYMYGQADHDTLRGQNGADHLRGDGGHDRLIGGEGSDTLSGDQEGLMNTDGQDQLDGGAGNDFLYGNGGDDILIGGAGDDELWGGAGADRFAFSGGAQGADKVRDFSAAQGDRFDLDGGQFTAAAATANGTALTWAGGTITVENVTGLSLADWNALVVQGANTEVRLTNAFDNILRYAPTNDTDRAWIKTLSGQVSSGAKTEAAALNEIVQKADASAAVATTNYAFFTGKTPGEGGMDFLLSPIGPNPNNINSAYYQSFNAENRYINFAVNLGRDGEGKAAFQTEYGGKSLADATKTAYAKIFGAAADDAKVASLLADGRAAYFATYGGDGANGQGTKAAMVGWLLAEAMKADAGMYAKASNAYFVDMADGAPFQVDLVGVYGKAEFNL